MLGWEDPLEKRMATHSSILAWRIPWTILFHGIAKHWTQLSDFHFHFSSNNYYHFANLVSCRFSSANHPHHMHMHTHTHTHTHTHILGPSVGQVVLKRVLVTMSFHL